MGKVHYESSRGGNDQTEEVGDNLIKSKDNLSKNNFTENNDDEPRVMAIQISDRDVIQNENEFNQDMIEENKQNDAVFDQLSQSSSSVDSISTRDQ